MRRAKVTAVTRTAIFAAAFLVTFSMTGCASTGNAAVTSAVTFAPATLASQVALVDGDLINGAKVSLIPGGDQVKGQVTFENCGYRFSTEAHRVARLQLDLLTAKGQPSGASNEVVVYDSPGEATKALVEFRKSVTGCRKNVFYQSAVAGIPDLRYDYSSLATASNLPVSDNVVARGAVTGRGPHQHLYAVWIFQHRGRVVTALYLESAAKLKAADLAAMQVLANATGKRLAAVQQ